MGTRGRTILIAALAPVLALVSCDEPASGPLLVTAIGPPPRLANPNLKALDPPSAFLVEAVAQGLVRFDGMGEIEPALAQSWIVSDDGLRYTFRVRPTNWSGGSRVSAEQVAGRVRAAISRASRNQLKSVLGAVQDAEAMTDQVLEISLRGPRPNFLQLLAQPEAAILQNGEGTGPYQAFLAPGGAVRLGMARREGEDEDDGAAVLPEIVLRGEGASRAVTAFVQGSAELIIGGTAGDLPYARGSGAADQRLVFDPVAGLFGLAFMAPGEESPLTQAEIRRALSMAIDRDGLVAALAVPSLRPRMRILPGTASEIPTPAGPDWGAAPLPMRRELARRVTSRLETPLRLRIAMPASPGYRIVFAYLRRDWRLIGVEVERVSPGAPADLQLVDEVAPAALASWYLRQFACDTRRLCDPAVDQALEAARATASPVERQAQLAHADRILTESTLFIPLAGPVRWSLVSPRLTGFRPNPFARHPAVTLVAREF